MLQNDFSYGEVHIKTCKSWLNLGSYVQDIKVQNIMNGPCFWTQDWIKFEVWVSNCVEWFFKLGSTRFDEKLMPH